MSNNLLVRFRKLLPQDPLQVGTVTAHNPDGTSTIQLDSGDHVRVLGQSVAINSRAFFQSGRVQGEAPNLPTYDITV